MLADPSRALLSKRNVCLETAPSAVGWAPIDTRECEKQPRKNMGLCAREEVQQQLEKCLRFNALRGRQLWRNQGNSGQGKATALMRLRFAAERLLTRIDDARRFENHWRDRRVIIAHRVPRYAFTQECWFSLRELERQARVARRRAGLRGP